MIKTIRIPQKIKNSFIEKFKSNVKWFFDDIEVIDRLDKVHYEFVVYNGTFGEWNISASIDKSNGFQGCDKCGIYCCDISLFNRDRQRFTIYNKDLSISFCEREYSKQRIDIMAGRASSCYRICHIIDNVFDSEFIKVIEDE